MGSMNIVQRRSDPTLGLGVVVFVLLYCNCSCMTSKRRLPGTSCSKLWTASNSAVEMFLEGKMYVKYYIEV